MSKTVLITGTSTGFGRMTALKFRDEGWNVVATMRSPDKETELNQLDRVTVARLDVTDVDSIKSAVQQALERYGSIDVMVNNAGFGAHGLFEQYTAQEAQEIYTTNVFGTMNTCREVLPQMRAQGGGVVVNVTSIAGLMGSPGTTLYSGTKFALEGFSEALAMEYRAWGIRVHTIAPGSFATDFSAASNDAWERGEGPYGNYGRKLGQFMEKTIADMRMASGQESDPREVAELAYECATGNMPIHNVAGADARNLAEMIESMPREEFLQGLIQSLPLPD